MMAKIGFAVSLVVMCLEVILLVLGIAEMLCNEGIDVGKKSIRMQKLVTKTVLGRRFWSMFLRLRRLVK